jgi:hypothetical protein
MNEHLFEPDGIAKAWVSVFRACKFFGMDDDRTTDIVHELTFALILDDLQMKRELFEEEFEALDEEVVNSHIDRYFVELERKLDEYRGKAAASSKSEQE